MKCDNWIFVLILGLLCHVQAQNPILNNNPLLADFDDLLFIERSILSDNTNSEYDGRHMCDQQYGHNARKGGGLYILKNFKSANPVRVNVVNGLRVPNGTNAGMLLSEGAFISPDLSYDGKSIVFGWASGDTEKWVQKNRFNLFRVDIDGTNLMRLTDSDNDDLDPIWLPNGRIMFISTRRGGFGRCHGRPVPTFTLHSMKADGSDLYIVDWHETNEWQPSVDNDGMVVYTRWDYIDRDSDVAHHLWTTYPDGRDPRAPHGNYPFPLTTLPEVLSYNLTSGDGRKMRPWQEYSIRAIPGSKKYVAIAGPHHGQSFGTVILIDKRIEDDNLLSQIVRVTPDVNFPESEGGGQLYGTPWPLSEDYFLINYQDGLYLLDRSQNRTLIYTTTATNFRPIDPIPVKARPTPPVIPIQTFQGERMTPTTPNATIYINNVYVTDKEGKLPDGVSIKEMRIVQVFPKSTPNVNNPRIHYGEQGIARMALGTVPVESDGSVYTKAPVGKEILFQLLDDNGMAVQSMRSGTYVHPGEQMSCTGCHESKWEATPVTPNPIAMQRPPSELKAEAGGVEPINFYRLVKPVFDGKCVPCHQNNAGPSSMNYGDLQSYAFYFHGGGNGSINAPIYGGSRTIPGYYGANYSRMGKALLNPTHQTAMTNGNYSYDDYRRIVVWLDNMSNELGAYQNVDAQKRGELVWPIYDVDPTNPTGVENRIVSISKKDFIQNFTKKVSLIHDQRSLLIQIPETGSSNISINDFKGTELLRQVVNADVNQEGAQNIYVSTRDFPIGVYFVRVQVNDKLYRSKLIILEE